MNDQQLRVTLRNFRQGLQPAPMLRIVAEVMRESIERTFREEGPGWPPLAASTLKRLGKLASGHKLLVRSGRLRNSITYAIVGGNRLLIGTNVVYAAIHQMGGQAGRNRAAHIPARPYLVFRPEDPERIVAALDRYIAMQAKQAGF